MFIFAYIFLSISFHLVLAQGLNLPTSAPPPLSNNLVPSHLQIPTYFIIINRSEAHGPGKFQ